MRFKDIFSWEKIVDDVRNWAVGILMTAALAIIVAIGVPVWKALKQQPFPWTVSGVFVAIAIGLLVPTIIILRRRPVSRSGLQRISDLLDTKIKEGEKAAPDLRRNSPLNPAQTSKIPIQ